MRKIREVLRLKFDLQLSDRDIGRSSNLGRTTVQNYLKRAENAGLTWPLSPEISDVQLEGLLFRQREVRQVDAAAEPDWSQMDKELRRKGVTRLLLWEEYSRQHPDGLKYATFNAHYRAWKGTTGLSMRQIHRAGEKLFVDYAGLTLAITDPNTGVVHPGQVFVATLGASDYTYVEVTRTQSSADWLASHVRALNFLGGVPEIIVPDNLKAGVTHASRYDPELNRAYAEFAQHYGVAIIPARVRKPKDKALVEVHVQIVERRLLAPLRDRVFFSVSEANETLWPLLDELNTQPFQKRAGSRHGLFVALDQPVLRPLPSRPFEWAQWKTSTVGLDYHVAVLGHAYSVPYTHIKARVEIRITPHLIEFFRDQVVIATHQRVLEPSSTLVGHTTLKAHMPPSHRQWSEHGAEQVLTQAEGVGEATAQLITALMKGERHPEQELRSAMGVLALSKAYGATRLEAACRRAVFLHAYSVQSVQSILKHRLDEAALPTADLPPRVADHVNVRGPAYYQPAAPQTHTDEDDQLPVVLDYDPTLN